VRKGRRLLRFLDQEHLYAKPRVSSSRSFNKVLGNKDVFVLYLQNV